MSGKSGMFSGEGKTALIFLLICLVLGDFIGPNKAWSSRQEVKEILLDKPIITKPHPITITIPTDDNSDWLRLTSGEILKGELKRLIKNKVYFKSEKLGSMEIPFDDIDQIISKKEFSVRIKGFNKIQGSVVLSGDKVQILSKKDNRDFQRDALVAISKGEAREINFWSSKINFGLSLASGNTQQTLWSAIADIKRQTLVTRLNVDYVGNFVETDGEESINSQILDTGLDWFLSDRWYLRPFFFQYYRDPQSNISNRITAGSGLGYRLLTGPRFEWDVTGGPAYRRTEFGEVPSDDKLIQETLAIALSTSFEAKLTDSTNFGLRYGIEFVDNSSGLFSHHLLTTFDTALGDHLNFNVSFGWDRIQEPQANSEGDIPKKDDYYLIFGLGFDL